MRVLLDTAAFLWAAASPELLSRAAAAALARMGSGGELSALSLTEIAVKAGAGKIEFSREDAWRGMEATGLRVLPYTAEHARILFALPWHHRDPFDRQIIAQAMAEGLPVVTPDRMFRLYRGLRVIW